MFPFKLNLRSLCLAVLFCLGYSTSYGQLVLEFSDGTSTGPTFNVPVGSSQTISVVVTETAGDTTLSTDGLNSFGFAINSTGTSADTTIFTENSDFSLVPINTVSLGASSELFVGSRPAAFPALPPVFGSSVSLGSLDIDVAAAGPTTFTLSAPAVDGFSNLDEILDPLVFGGGGERGFSFVINGISSIPEPSGGLLIAFSTLATMMRRKRNRS